MRGLLQPRALAARAQHVSPRFFIASFIGARELFFSDDLSLFSPTSISQTRTATGLTATGLTGTIPTGTTPTDTILMGTGLMGTGLMATTLTATTRTRTRRTGIGLTDIDHIHIIRARLRSRRCRAAFFFRVAFVALILTRRRVTRVSLQIPRTGTVHTATIRTTRMGIARTTTTHTTRTTRTTRIGRTRTTRTTRTIRATRRTPRGPGGRRAPARRRAARSRGRGRRTRNATMDYAGGS